MDVGHGEKKEAKRKILTHSQKLVVKHHSKNSCGIESTSSFSRIIGKVRKGRDYFIRLCKKVLRNLTLSVDAKKSLGIDGMN
jgi:hypothetical protein